MSDELRGSGDHHALDAATIQEIEAIAASLTYEDLELESPPADLWGRISSSFDSEATNSPTQTRERNAPAPSGAKVTNLSQHSEARNRRPRQALILGAAAAVVVIAAVTIGVLVAEGGNGEVVASADLEPLAEGYIGEASLAAADQGFTLELLLESLPTLEESEGYYEVWLIKSLDTGEMQSLGFVDGSQDIELPPGLNPAEYSTVDLSIEPLDGVPTHSGQSVLRGTLVSEV
ncbi:MAG: anti-sigma factor [Acidimicrobiales bacterium]